MKQIARKSIAILLSLMMLFTSVPSTTLAAIVSETSNTVNFGSMVKSIEPDDGTNVYVTFEFYVDGELVDQQIVNQTAEESVIAPATPETESGKRFLGWYVGDKPMTFGEVSGYTTNTDVKVDAHFSDVYYVYFLTVEGDVHATGEATAESGWKVTVPVDYEPKDAVVDHWLIKDTATQFTNDTVVTQDMYVTPFTSPCYWITFNTMGGSLIKSVYITQGDSYNLNDVETTRVGYEFAGWTMPSAEDATVSNNVITPKKSVTLTANWDPADVTYTIVYWGENADDEYYSPMSDLMPDGPITGKAKTGTTAKDLMSSITLPTVTHFDDVDPSYDETITVAPDGSTVIDVYYTRDLYTLTFKADVPTGECSIEEHTHTTKPSSTSGVANGTVNGCWILTGNRNKRWEINCGKTEHTHGDGNCNVETTEQDVATITAKYDANISGRFGEAPFTTTYNGRAWESSRYSYALQTLDRMPGFNATFTL